jgi:hypothetical protein
MVKVGTGDAAVGAEEDGVRWHPVSLEWRPNSKKVALRRPWVDHVILARMRRCGTKARLERQSEMGVESSVRAAKVKGGLASSFGHDHKGIRWFEAAHVEAVAARVAHGGREG